MPRSYKKISERGKWSEAAMRDAISAVKDRKEQVKVAARHYGVPFATLRRHVLKLVKAPGKKNLGNSMRQIFSDCAEQQLTDYIIEMQRVGFGLTRSDIMQIAFEYSKLLYLL